MHRITDYHGDNLYFTIGLDEPSRSNFHATQRTHIVVTQLDQSIKYRCVECKFPVDFGVILLE